MTWGTMVMSHEDNGDMGTIETEGTTVIWE